MSTYWEKRAENLVKQQITKDNKFASKLAKEYTKLGAMIEKEIASYYSKYASEDVIEYRRMLEQLTDTERDLLYKDYQSFASKYPKYAHLMPVRESIYKLNRLEGLQLNIQLKLYEIGAIEEAEYQNHLEAAYTLGYLQTLKGLDNPQTFFSVNSFTMQQALTNKWVEGGNFSDRIWSNKEKLIKTLTTEIRDAMIRGESYKDMVQLIQHRMGVGKFNAKRLVHTESAYMMTQANGQAFQDAGIKRYEICAVIDHKTSKICRELDGQVFEFSKMKVGINYPPFHSFCRTTIVPVENDEVLIPKEKKARNIIPNINTASIEDKKLFGYILNKKHEVGGDKALVFDKVLGYNETNGELLRKEVIEKLPESYTEFRGEDKFGKRYGTYIELTGLKNRKVLATAGWILSDGLLRLTTLFILDEKKAQKIIEKIRKEINGND
ncbi:minor capsid protein [Lysinibacillus halotolerans]